LKNTFKVNTTYPSPSQSFQIAFRPSDTTLPCQIQIHKNWIMAAPITMDVRPITTPHLDLDHLPPADRDFQIRDTIAYEVLLKLHCLSRDKYLSQSDDIGLWESNFPKYQFPQVHVFPKIVHMCHTCYIPIQRAIMSPDQKVLFTITAESINEMLQVQPGPNLIPLSIGDLLD